MPKNITERRAAWMIAQVNGWLAHTNQPLCAVLHQAFYTALPLPD